MLIGPRLGADKPRINVHLIARDQEQDRSTAMIPERPVQVSHVGSIDSIDLLEIDERRVLSAKHAVEAKKLESVAKHMRLRCRPAFLHDVGLAGEEKLRSGLIEA